MKFRLRKTVRLGPVKVNFTEKGYSSWGLKVWRWTWNARTGKHTVDTPGPGSVQLGGRRTRRS